MVDLIVAGALLLATQHVERGLTRVSIDLSGEGRLTVDTALLAEYRGWVATNRADVADGLFDGDIPPIREFDVSPENATTHRELVADWQAQR